MTGSPNSLEQLEWTLWCTAMCQCSGCKDILPFEEHDDILDRPDVWAKVVAPMVRSLGWSALSDFELVCDQCRKPGAGAD